MRPASIILVLLFILAAPFSVFAQSLGPQNYTYARANTTLSNATAYLSRINDSGYLVFTPNLRQAYSYLGTAKLLLNKSPQGSVLYSNLAVKSARRAYGNIESYRETSILGALVFTIAMGLILYRFMVPVKKNR